MKKLIIVALALNCACALAAQPALLEGALQCKLADKDLASMMRALAAANPGMAKPAFQYGAPTVNVYQLAAPVTAFGYSSSTIAVMPGRILLAVSGTSLAAASARLKLEEQSFSPASRTVRPTVSVVAFQLSHKALEGKLLLGCEYGSAAAAAWSGADGF